MEPDTVHQLAVVVENVLAAFIFSLDGPRCAVLELAFAELHQIGLQHDWPEKSQQTGKGSHGLCCPWSGTALADMARAGWRQTS
jgi:hypothetical protein